MTVNGCLSLEPTAYGPSKLIFFVVVTRKLTSFSFFFFISLEWYYWNWHSFSQSNIKNSLLGISKFCVFLLFSIIKMHEANSMQWLIRNSFVPSFRTIDLSTYQRFPFVFYSPIDFIVKQKVINQLLCARWNRKKKKKKKVRRSSSSQRWSVKKD